MQMEDGMRKREIKRVRDGREISDRKKQTCCLLRVFVRYKQGEKFVWNYGLSEKKKIWIIVLSKSF